MISIGIDVGARNGAIAIIDDSLKIHYLAKAPYLEVEAAHTSANRNKPKLNKETGKFEQVYRKRAWTDYRQFRGIFQPYVNSDIIYTMERVSVRHGEGEISSFIFGNSLGCFEGLSAYLNPKAIYEPTPAQWKEVLGVTSDKNTSLTLAEDIFEISLKDYVQKGKVDDIAEALLLALYGFRAYLNEQENKEKK